MKLSVIVPVYNSSKYLRRCLDSISSQSFRDFELILVDDQSNDNSLDIINEFIAIHSDMDVKLLNIKHGGSSIARKKGLDIAKGDYIGFVDSDDYINDRYYEILIREIEDNDIICSDIQVGNKIKRNKYEDNIIDSDKAKLSIFNQEGVYQYLVNKIYKRELFDNVYFPQADMIGEDFIVVLQVIDKARSIKTINNNLYYYDFNEDSQSRSMFCDKHRNMYEEFNKLLIQYKDNEFLNPLKRYILIHYMAILVSMTRNNQYDKELIDRILEFVRENKKDYLRYSNDSLKAKLAVMVVSNNYRLFNFITKLVNRYQV